MNQRTIDIDLPVETILYIDGEEVVVEGHNLTIKEDYIEMGSWGGTTEPVLEQKIATIEVSTINGDGLCE